MDGIAEIYDCITIIYLLCIAKSVTNSAESAVPSRGDLIKNVISGCSSVQVPACVWCQPEERAVL